MRALNLLLLPLALVTSCSRSSSEPPPAQPSGEATGSEPAAPSIVTATVTRAVDPRPVATGNRAAAGAPAPAPEIANPASRHCIDHGGRLEVRTNAAGEAGHCVFPDGSACEEWAYYRGECAAGSKK